MMIKIIKGLFSYLKETSQNHVFQSKMDAKLIFKQNCQRQNKYFSMFKIK